MEHYVEKITTLDVFISSRNCALSKKCSIHTPKTPKAAPCKTLRVCSHKATLTDEDVIA